MHLDDFAAFVAEICAHSAAAPERPLRWTIIANPRAGGFTIASRWKAHRAVLERAALRARERNARRDGAGPSRTAGTGLAATEGPGHARRITEALVEEAAAEARNGNGAVFYLIICAGGDGTSLEVLSALYAAREETREQFAVLRLPMGTGNDGADAWDLERALELLIIPTRIEKSAALRLVTATPGKGPFLAFNILSAGLDAFVTHVTNKMKGRLPGDSYKLWVDIAALLYDRIYRVGPLSIAAFDAAGNRIENRRETTLLLAVGVSGHRTYGARKRILPDDRNVCLVRQMSLFRKIALKDMFTTGAHIHEKESLLFSADRVEFSGEFPILAQMDGETVLLEKRDFPAAIERTAPVIPLLKPLD
ncbi:MAG: diacylglycerol kinase [Spirochaetaceae bacterium]|jgi:diacylglycerol kinase family enzyme|nr:diacylglycerol kinase [Spirochaetaceae bacterium]